MSEKNLRLWSLATFHVYFYSFSVFPIRKPFVKLQQRKQIHADKYRFHVTEKDKETFTQLIFPGANV